MESLINRVQQQLDNNHAVEADDIQALVNYANKQPSITLDALRMEINELTSINNGKYLYKKEVLKLVKIIDDYNANT